MKRSHLKNQLALPLLGAALFGVAYYVLFKATPPAPPADATMEMRKAFELYGWVREAAYVLMWLCLAFIVVRVLAAAVFYLFRRRKGYEAPSLVRDIFSLVVYTVVVAFVLKESYPELSLTALLPTSALVGVILGLALQDTLGNLFAGISLHADKPFQAGDVITVGKWTGVVESITWRAVKVRAFSNHVYLFSNSVLAKESIEVCPRGNANARYVFFSAEYTDSPVKVIHVVREAVREAENVLRYMTPVVRIRELGASGIDYEVKYWLQDYARHNDTDALVRQRIWYAFRRAGLSFSYPVQVHVEREHVTDGRGASFDHISERLSAVDIFSPLTAAELKRLAENTTARVFAPGETIIRAGDNGSSMFVVHEGQVDVLLVEPNGQTRKVSTLGEGAFFGEMALFTGEARTASIIAAEETEVLEIGHIAMKRLFETNPDLVEALSHIIAERRAGLKATPEETHDGEHESAGLLKAVRRFFGFD